MINLKRVRNVKERICISLHYCPLITGKNTRRNQTLRKKHEQTKDFQSSSISSSHVVVRFLKVIALNLRIIITIQIISQISKTTLVLALKTMLFALASIQFLTMEKTEHLFSWIINCWRNMTYNIPKIIAPLQNPFHK